MVYVLLQIGLLIWVWYIVFVFCAAWFIGRINRSWRNQLERYIYLPNCLKVVFNLSVPEYILTLKIDSIASVLP